MEHQNNLGTMIGPYVLGYWILSGAACVALFILLNKTSEHPQQFGSQKTPLARGVFSFIFGGAIVPMAFLLFFPLVLGGWAGEIQERKWQERKKTLEDAKT